MANQIRSFLGTGWAFPPSFDKITNSVRMVSEQEDIAESIRIILNTIPGERVMEPEFGCDIRRLVFEKVDANFVSELNNMIYKALLHFEPRVKFISAGVLERKELDGVIYFEVDYSIIVTNTRHNIVFPYYILEGTDVPR